MPALRTSVIHIENNNGSHPQMALPDACCYQGIKWLKEDRSWESCWCLHRDPRGKELPIPPTSGSKSCCCNGLTGAETGHTSPEAGTWSQLFGWEQSPACVSQLCQYLSPPTPHYGSPLEKQSGDS